MSPSGTARGLTVFFSLDLSSAGCVCVAFPILETVAFRVMVSQGRGAFRVTAAAVAKFTASHREVSGTGGHCPVRSRRSPGCLWLGKLGDTDRERDHRSFCTKTRAVRRLVLCSLVCGPVSPDLRSGLAGLGGLQTSARVAVGHM